MQHVFSNELSRMPYVPLMTRFHRYCSRFPRHDKEPEISNFQTYGTPPPQKDRLQRKRFKKYSIIKRIRLRRALLTTTKQKGLLKHVAWEHLKFYIIIKIIFFSLWCEELYSAYKYCLRIRVLPPLNPRSVTGCESLQGDRLKIGSRCRNRSN